MLNILMMIILIIILIIIIILILGIKINLEFKKSGSELKGCFKILILKKIKIYSLNYPSQNEDEKTEDTGKKRDIKKLLNLSKPCLNDLLNFLKTVTESIKITKIENHIIFGLDDYADTGKYIGIIWAIFAMIDSVDKNIKLTAEPSFNGESVIDGYGTNQLEIYPIKIIIPLIRLISNKDVRLLIRGVLDGK